MTTVTIFVPIDKLVTLSVIKTVDNVELLDLDGPLAKELSAQLHFYTEPMHSPKCVAVNVVDTVFLALMYIKEKHLL